MNSCLDKIVNPETGRKVRLDSKRGKTIIGNYLLNLREMQQGGGDDKDKKVTPTEEQRAQADAEFKKHQAEIQRLSKELNTRIGTIEKEHIDPAEELARQADRKYRTGSKLHRDAFDSVVPKISRSVSLLRNTKTHPKDRCYRSISRGTCEPEYYFDERMEDRDQSANKCSFDPKSNMCSANYDNWSYPDNGQIIRQIGSLDRHDESDMYWSSDSHGNYRPFITHHNPKQLAKHAHGQVSH